MRYVHRRLVLIVVLTLTASCDEGPTTVVDRRVEGTWSMAQGAMAKGPLPVVVEGDPFESQRPLDERIVALMTEAVTWTATPRFAADASASGGLRVVITFDPAVSMGGSAQCAGEAGRGERSRDGAVRVLATFCDGRTMLVSVSGRAADAKAPDDAEFDALIRQITLDLFTPEQPGR